MAQVIQYDATDRKFGNPPIATYQCGIARSHELRRELEEDGFSVEVEYTETEADFMADQEIDAWSLRASFCGA